MIPSDPHISAAAEADLERRLRALPLPPGPDPRFRAELLVQLLAALERGVQPEIEAVRAPRLVGGRHAAARNRRFGLPQSGFALPRPGRATIAILGAAVAVLLVITGTTYWLAQRALPGDALYGLKRASESVDLSIKDGDANRGTAYLSLSTTRIDEAAALVKRATSAAEPGAVGRDRVLSAGGPLSPHLDELVRGALNDGDTAAVDATRLLTTASVAHRAQQPVNSVSTWLADQRVTVGTLVARLPDTAPTTAGGAARTLQRDLIAIQTRVKAITASVKCGTCRFTRSDRFGPLPCSRCPRPVIAPPATHPKATTTHRRPAPTVATTAPSSSPSASPTPTGSAPPPPTSAPGTTAGTVTTLPPTPTPTSNPPDHGSPTRTSAPPTSDPSTVPVPVPTLDPSCLPVICTDAPAAATS